MPAAWWRISARHTALLRVFSLSPLFPTASQETISGTTFVTVQATGTVTYQPRNGKCCCKPQVKMFTESFDIIFKGTGTPALALTQGVTSRAPANVKCNGNVYGYSMVTDVTITATFPG